MAMVRNVSIVLLLVAHAANVFAQTADIYQEQYRPQFHFSAKSGWLNDPNGLVYQNGQFHLFYQHNPFGEGWGNMTWGHATSPDLVHWTEKSPALAAESTGVKFSGTAAIDFDNTAGLQTGDTPTMALFYTNVNGSAFDQRMAYSNDGGRSFRYSADNPILGTQSGGRDDRDPQVFWHEESDKWVQVLWVPYTSGNGLPGRFQFFGSQNLTDWNYLSETNEYFECPDFFELPVDGNAGNSKWVTYGANGDYQIGTFDGTSFVAESGKLKQDYGHNFYAAQTYHDVPSDDGRRIQVTWMQGASYPGMPFNQQMGFPTELTLRTTGDGVRMFREPIEEIELLHQGQQSLSNVVFGPGQDPLGNLAGELFHIVADIQLNNATSVGFNIRGHEVRYDVNSQTLSALGRSAPLAPTNGRVQMELLVDRSSLELFGGDGRVALTSGFLPSADNLAIDLFATGGNARIVSLSAYELGSAWPDAAPQPTEGLLGHWKFDEPSLAANFINAAGTEYDLANSGLVSDRTGRAGRAVQLDNANDHAYIPNHTGLNAESFTVAFWVKPDSMGQAGNLISKTHVQEGTWGVTQLADGRLGFSVRTGTDAEDSIETNVPIHSHTWNHAVASYNADTGRMELYLNGQFAGASEYNIEGSPMFDDSPLMIGWQRIGENLDAARGDFDDLQFYGTALTPGQIGHLYLNPGTAIDPAAFDPSTLKLVIDVETGAASIASVDGATTNLKGYSIFSTTASLNATGWQSLADSSNPSYNGWDEANPSGGVLSELNPFGSLVVNGSSSVTLGSPIAAEGLLPFGTRATNLDVSFQYTTADGQVFNGSVEIANGVSVNNLLLEVDPVSGEGVLTNASGYTIQLSGYTIASASGSLQASGWTSLSDQQVDGVDEANSSSEFLSELAPSMQQGIVLAPGQSYSMGELFRTDGEQDVELEFVLREFLPLDGDYNSDGSVNLADYVVWRDALGSNVSLPNESATPGMVTAEDYQVWKASFGSTANFTLQLMKGVVEYRTALAAGSSVVPEPATLASTMILLALVHSCRSRIRKNSGA